MSSIFDLDPAGRKVLDENAQVLGFDATTPPPPSGFAGFGQAGKQLLGASASAGRTLLSLPLAGTAALDQLYGFTTAQPYYSGTTDWWAKNVVDHIGQNAVDYWTPDATEMGAASKVLGNVFHIVGSVPQMIGTPEVFLANSAFSPATDLTRQGVDAKTALEVGGVSLAVNAAGFRLPAAIGSTLATRVATGIGVNEALGIANEATTKALLQSGGYDQLAQGYDWQSLKNRSLDAVMGAVFGAVGHVHAQAELRDQSVRDFLAQGNTGAAKDALMTQLNGEHFAASALPGVPVDPAAVGQAQRALSNAIGQILRGESVNVAEQIDPSKFIVREPAPASADYTAYRRALESGGNANARNPNSSAAGIDQFTDKTWLATVAASKPEWAEGLTRQELLDARLDPAKSGEMADVLDHENALTLRNAGVPVDNHTLYAAHHFGADKAIAFAKAAPDTPVADILGKRQLEANPYLKGKTKAEVLANWDKRAGEPAAGQALRARLEGNPEQLFQDYAARPDSEGGRVLNTDTARELAPEYLADRTRSADVHEAASDTIKALYAKKLAEPTPEGFDRSVLFTAGGTGAGKSTAIRALQGVDHPPEIVYDTNMNTLASAEKKVAQALDAGRDVQILYVHRDPVDALVNGALPRAERQAGTFGSGRTVPLAEHAKTHLGVRPVIEALAEKYKDDPRVQIKAFDNSRGKGKGQFAELAQIPRVEENNLRERLQEAVDKEHQAGRISDATLAGFAQPGRPEGVQQPVVQSSGRQPEPQRGEGVTPAAFPEEALAANIAAQVPDLEITLDDGSTVNAADALRAADAAIQQAQQDSLGFEAAALCAAGYRNA